MRLRVERTRAAAHGEEQIAITTPVGAIPRWVPRPVAQHVARAVGAVPPRMLVLIDNVRDIAQASTAHRTPLVAGGLAFFVLLAIAPAAIVIGALVGLVLTPADLAKLASDVSAVTPGATAQITPYTEALVSLAQESSGAAFSVASVIGVLIALYAASRFLYGLRLAMQGTFHTAHEERTRTSRVAAAITTAIGLLIASGLIVLIAVVQPVLHSVGIEVLDVLGSHRITVWILLAGAVLLMVRRTYRRLPGRGRRLPWRSMGVWLATGWIVVVTAGVGLYASRSTTLGAAVAVFGAPIVVMLWLYLCFVGLLLGAEIEAARERRVRSPNASGGPAKGGTP